MLVQPGGGGDNLLDELTRTGQRRGVVHLAGTVLQEFDGVGDAGLEGLVHLLRRRRQLDW